jgi:outer membrane protein OmpA-like peptidoglycan-associated protein
VALSQSQQQAVREQLEQARAAPEQATSEPAPASSQALADLELPVAAPPIPNVPGIDLRPAPVAAPAVAAPPPAPREPVDGPPIALAFAPDSAILSGDMVTALRALAAARGNARIRVGGFGEQRAMPDEAALTLGLVRARRIADALTAAGVPPAAITMTAAAAGSGGFAQLVY